MEFPVFWASRLRRVPVPRTISPATLFLDFTKYYNAPKSNAGGFEMSTQPQASPISDLPVHDDFLTYPIHKLVSVFENPNDVNAALDELLEHGFAADDIEAFCGVQGEKRMDFEGARHGVWATFIRAIQHFGPDRTYIERYEKHLRDGHCMIMVRVTNKERKETAARILHHHTKERVTYFGLLTADEIQ